MSTSEIVLTVLALTLGAYVSTAAFKAIIAVSRFGGISEEIKMLNLIAEMLEYRAEKAKNPKVAEIAERQASHVRKCIDLVASEDIWLPREF